jgi:hypothetical protein
MSSKIFILITLFSFILCERDSYQEGLMIIKDNLSKGIKPYNSDYSKYIKDIKVDIDLIYTKDYNLIKRKCDKNEKCMKLLNASNFSSYSTIIWRVEGKNSKILVGNTYNSIHIVSVNNERMFLYYTVKYNGNLIYQKEKVIKRVCKTVLITTSCKNVETLRQRAFNQKEIDIINETLEITHIIKVIAELNKYN